MPDDTKKRIDKLVRQARSELKKGNRQEALGLLKKALAIDPDSNAITEVMLEIENEETASKTTKPKPKPASKPPEPEEEKPASGSAAPTAEESGQPVRRKRRSSGGLRSVPDARPVREKKAAPSKPPPEQPTDDAELSALLQQVDDALDEGEEARAKSLLGKAKKLSPDEQALQGRIKRLKDLLKAKKAIAKGQAELKSGEPAKAVRYARIAFNLNPRVEGLDSLLRRLESLEGIDRAPTEGQEWARATESRSGSGSEAESYVQKIREKVQISSFPEAAQLAKEAHERYPDHELISTFAEKFKKMGLIEVEE